MTLKLKIVPIQYTIKFDKNSCLGDDIQDIICEYGKEYALPENKLTKAGYIVNGWKKKKLYYGYDCYNAGDVIKNLTTVDNETITFYSNYETDYETEYIITLENDLFKLSEEEKYIKLKSNTEICPYETVQSSPKKCLPNYLINSYEHQGWKIKGETELFTKSVKVISDMTFVAVFRPYKVDIEFKPKPRNSQSSLIQTFFIDENDESISFGSGSYFQTVEFGRPTPLKKLNYYAVVSLVEMVEMLENVIIALRVGLKILTRQQTKNIMLMKKIMIVMRMKFLMMKNLKNILAIRL